MSNRNMLLVAQLAERQIVTLDAVGSSPTFQPNCAQARKIFPLGV